MHIFHMLERLIKIGFPMLETHYISFQCKYSNRKRESQFSKHKNCIKRAVFGKKYCFWQVESAK